ncbi:MAG TPA: glycoside hydrolase N-terminal domain-containing protein, partial [Draconibacterium sp.]|nr:glycoside hydrolase N-terminal domain-containing protein [Draconibacterium sp.]
MNRIAQTGNNCHIQHCHSIDHKKHSLSIKKTDMNYLRISFSLIVMLAVLNCTNRKNVKEETDASFQLNLQAPIDKWEEAIPLGNGLTGGLLWGADNEIRLSLDRGDIWDLRPHPGFTNPDFSYETVRRMALAGEADSLNKQYARANDFPTKLPGCRLVLTLPEDMKAQSFHLDMTRGLGTVEFGEKKIECFFSAVKPVTLIMIPVAINEFHLLPNQAVSKLGNQPARIEKDENGTWLIQDAMLGFRYVFCVQSRKFKDYTLIAISTATNNDGEDPLKLAKEQTNNALEYGYIRLLKEHEKWWDDFWSKSSVTIPDSLIQRHYNLVQYYYGAASRKNA